MASPRSYSTKEVVDSAHIRAASSGSNASDKQVLGEQDKQVVAEPDKQVVEQASDLEVQHVYASSALSSPGSTDLEKGASLHSIRHRFMWTRTRILIAAIAVIVIVIGAVLGGVLGSRQLAANASSQADSSPSGSSASSRRNIAAVSFDGDANSRVYFLDDSGQIVESSRQVLGPNWTTTKTGFMARNGSKIAAAASRPGQDQEVTVIYMDSNNTLHDIISDSSGWHEGILAAQNIQPTAASALSVMYNWCALCSNTTLLSYQAPNGSIHLGNLTAKGWHMSTLDDSIDAAPGTSLALQPFFRTGEPDQINLWTQKIGTNELVMSDWREQNTANSDGWNIKVFTFNPMGLGAAIAAASSYTRTLNTGFETWIEVLTTGKTGVSVDTWSGASNDFIAHQMASEGLQLPVNKGQAYGSLAVTSQGNAFAVLSQEGKPDSITTWQVANDLITWSPTGNVDLGGNWN